MAQCGYVSLKLIKDTIVCNQFVLRWPPKLVGKAPPTTQQRHEALGRVGVPVKVIMVYSLGWNVKSSLEYLLDLDCHI